MHLFKNCHNQTKETEMKMHLDFSARWMMQRGSTDDKMPPRFKDRV